MVISCVDFLCVYCLCSGEASDSFMCDTYRPIDEFTKRIAGCKKAGFIERHADPRKERLRLRKFGVYNFPLILLVNASPYASLLAIYTERDEEKLKEAQASSEYRACLYCWA
jgi:hypothetical protein